MKQVATATCGDDTETTGKIFVCELRARGEHDGRPEAIAVRMWHLPDDVIGGYLMRIATGRSAEVGVGPVGVSLQSTLPARFPPPSRRTPPDIGDPVSPTREPRKYTLLSGSESLAVHGAGSITGGFDALLRVRKDRDALELGRAYAEQAAQSDGPIEVRRNGTTTTFVPPGGAGGYQGIISVLDQPGDDRDLIVYNFYNDRP